MLKIQKFLKTRKLDDLRNDPFNLHISSEDEMAIFKYNQFNSDFSDLIVQESRGIILEKNTWKIVCHPFHKFFNYGETNAYNIDLSKSYVMEKVDGCLDKNTIITTEDGEKTIEWICKNKYKGKILSYDVEEKKEVWDCIVDYSIQENNNDWYEIELENGKTIKLTGNHRVWLPKLNCYRKVEELNGDEDFLLKK